MHGEEVGLIAQFLDQLEFVGDEPLDVIRHAPRPAVALTLLRKMPQPCGGRVAVGHDFARVFVAQLVERERAAAGDFERGFDELRRIDSGETRDRAQVTLAVRVQSKASAIDRGADARRSEDVLQRAPAARVHVHIARGHERQAEFAAQGL